MSIAGETIYPNTSKATMIGRKRYATFYLPEMTLQFLEEMWIEIRAKHGMKALYKSNIVAHAVQHALEDIHKRGSRSRMIRDLEKWAAEREIEEREE